jgi:dihydroxyacetone kinase-like protein
MKITPNLVLEWLARCAQVIAENREFLTRLDAAIGDADHGANMDRGFKAVAARLPELQQADIGAILKAAGMALVATVGGAGGPLYGTLFLQAGAKAAGVMELSLADWTTALEAAVDGVAARGKSGPGDKTMLDALIPAVKALQQAAADEPFQVALQRSARAAEGGMLATIPLVARKGRASYLGERSAGHQDPGATSAYLILQAAADVWGG